MSRMLKDWGGGVVPAVRVTSFVDAPPGSGGLALLGARGGVGGGVSCFVRGAVGSV